jgi:hypothetical protein
MRRRAFGAEPGAPPEDIAAVIEAAKRYFAGEETDFSHVQVDLAGQDAFFAQIYHALRRVGWGGTTTYGALAKEVGAGRERARPQERHGRRNQADARSRRLGRAFARLEAGSLSARAFGLSLRALAVAEASVRRRGL